MLNLGPLNSKPFGLGTFSEFVFSDGSGYEISLAAVGKRGLSKGFLMLVALELKAFPGWGF